jgi:sulfite reductase alpha subunit-like flavoprotein
MEGALRLGWPDALAAIQLLRCALRAAGYPKYNSVSKKLYRRLEGLGARLVLPLGLGDDQHRSGYEAALDPWLAQLWAALRAEFPLPPDVGEVRM